MNKKTVFTFLLMVFLIQFTLILNYNLSYYTDNSQNNREEKSSLINLETAADFEYSEINGTIDDTKTLQI